MTQRLLAAFAHAARAIQTARDSGCPEEVIRAQAWKLMGQGDPDLRRAFSAGFGN